MTVPEDPTCVNFSDGQEEAERQIKQLCTRLLLGWGVLQVADMQVSRISGGISNLLVKVDPPAPLQPVAVKVFGDKTELLIDRDAEKRLLLQLNAVGFGAPVVGLFGNGRAEQFLTAKTLTPEEMLDPRFVPHIARRLRAFHDLQLDVPGVGASAAAAASASPPASARTAADTDAGAGATSGSDTSQWDAIFGWLAMAEGLSFAHDPAKQAAYDKVDFAAMRAELEALREVCGRMRSPRVLCHNDLLSGNILIVQRSEPGQPVAREALARAEPPAGQSSSTSSEQLEGQDGVSGRPGADGATASGTPGTSEDLLAGGDLQFIDFEYSCYGPRGFDWGNHFNEYAGFDCVYDRFPSAEQQKTFFRHYLKAGELQHMAQALLSAQEGGCGAEQRQLQLPDGDRSAAAGAEEGAAAALAAAEEAVLDRLVAEACVYALASHAYWGVWSFIQARYSPIDFDYLDYSRMRWAEYYRRRDEFFGMVHRHFASTK